MYILYTLNKQMCAVWWEQDGDSSTDEGQHIELAKKQGTASAQKLSQLQWIREEHNWCPPQIQKNGGSETIYSLRSSSLRWSHLGTVATVEFFVNKFPLDANMSFSCNWTALQRNICSWKWREEGGINASETGENLWFSDSPRSFGALSAFKITGIIFLGEE